MSSDSKQIRARAFTRRVSAEREVIIFLNVCAVHLRHINEANFKLLNIELKSRHVLKSESV